MLAPRAAEAFCGFYVAGGDQQMFNDATQVVLMRHGTRTVLSMQNNYKGPPTDFAMVIPVPVVLKEADVKTLTKDVFEHVDKMGAPRLVEYWEQDPCNQFDLEEGKMGKKESTRSYGAYSMKKSADDLGVTVEAKFTVGEYDIVILSAKEAAGLDTWLRQEKYRIPAGAEPLLRPYVEGGQKFFVAKVDPKKVKFEGDRAALSPLRFHYDSEQFNLPIRLGLANSSGKQDLIVNILALGQRYEVANYKNVTIPTNLDVKKSVRDKFGAFYTALFDATIEKNPGAVVTEYAWQATNCDPCPGPVISRSELEILGLDVLGDDAKRGVMSMVLTRLHARYGKDITNDLEFKAAPPIVGGREHVVDWENRKLEEGAKPSGMNNFQGRYAIRHAWDKPITCENPVRGRWGGPPDGGTASKPTPALGLAFAARGAVALPTAVKHDIPELGIKAIEAATLTDLAGGMPSPTTPTTPATPSTPPVEAKKTGCGCQSTGSGASASGGLGLAVLALIFSGPIRRRRRQRA